MITYREATANDAEKIALLHAQSWQRHYRGIMQDAYLDGPVEENRLEVWKGRLHNPQDKQYVLVAEEDDQLCGFACVFAEYDPAWGALLDNLHVSQQYQGKGIGARLLKSAAKWAYMRNPDAGFYLWVFVKNTSARKFYENLGATNQEVVATENPDGGFADACRYVWTDVKKLVETNS